MLGLSLQEFFVLLVAVVVFVRPEDLPQFVRSLGRLYGKIQRFVHEARSVTRSTIREIESMDKDIKAGIDEIKHPFQGEFVPPTPFSSDEDYCESAHDHEYVETCDHFDADNEAHEDQSPEHVTREDVTPAELIPAPETSQQKHDSKPQESATEQAS